MTARLTPNDGSRPSRFALARYATGESSAEERAIIDAALASDPALRERLAELERTREVTPKFDFAAIRGRFEDVAPNPVAAEVPSPAPANRIPRWLAPALMLAAGLLVAVLWARPTDDGLQVRGDGTLLVYELDGDVLVPYAGRPLSEGDVVGFKVRPGEFTSVVLVSVDGDGLASVLYPAEGNDPEPVPGDGRTVELPGTITLDDAPGPEVVVAVFDRTVAAALEDAADRYEAGGADALAAWGRDAHDVDTVTLERE